MPIDGTELAGTERDGSKSNEYCKYCYQQGKFTDPDMTWDEMRKNVIEQMEKEKVPEDMIETAVGRLQHLKRWSNKMPAQ